ncbi:MAG: glutaredoxin family protein [Gallionellaceae bacterium]|nr:glutaredoxin family protein [Gallionellaceae bacterium]
MNKYLWLAMFVLAANVQAETYYRSIDKNGKVHYGEKPVEGADDVAALQARAAPNIDETLPFETRRAKEKYPVTLYLADECAEGCKQAREYLLKRGIPFTEKKLVTVDDVEAFKKETASDRLPVIKIGKTLLKGFLQSQWAGELDSAGYPQNASYGFRAVVKPAPAMKSNNTQ